METDQDTEARLEAICEKYLRGGRETITIEKRHILLLFKTLSHLVWASNPHIAKQLSPGELRHELREAIEELEQSQHIQT